MDGTNNQLCDMSNSYSRGDWDCQQTDDYEILAFLEVLYLLELKKANHLKHFWNLVNGGTVPEFFQAVMSKRCFHLLSDLWDLIKDKLGMWEKTDNLALIRRDIFCDLFTQYINKYTSGAHVTLNEMLEAFGGTLNFR